MHFGHPELTFERRAARGGSIRVCSARSRQGIGEQDSGRERHVVPDPNISPHHGWEDDRIDMDPSRLADKILKRERFRRCRDRPVEYLEYIADEGECHSGIATSLCLRAEFLRVPLKMLEESVNVPVNALLVRRCNQSCNVDARAIARESLAEHLRQRGLQRSSLWPVPGNRRAAVIRGSPGIDDDVERLLRALPVTKCLPNLPLGDDVGLIGIRERQAFRHPSSECERIELSVYGIEVPSLADRLDAEAPNPKKRAALRLVPH